MQSGVAGKPAGPDHYVTRRVMVDRALSPKSTVLAQTTETPNRGSASLNLRKGFKPMEVSTITGHKTLQMLKRYTHFRA
jgi:hypothetical protein